MQSKRRSLGWGGVGPISPKSMLAVFNIAAEYSGIGHCQVNSYEEHPDESKGSTDHSQSSRNTVDFMTDNTIRIGR